MTDDLRWWGRDGEPLGHALRGLWAGCAAFLVGGGPSLNQVDRASLGRRGVLSLAINNAAGWVPATAVVFADPPRKIHHAVLSDPKLLKLVPREKLRQRVRYKLAGGGWREGPKLRELPAVFAFERSSEFRPEEFLSGPAQWGCNSAGAAATGRPKTLSTLLLGLRLLHYLGTARVHLLGVDFDMPVVTKREREIGNYAWGQAGSALSNNDAYRVLAGWLEELRPVLERAGMPVYNCNPRSRLRAFPHVQFARALADCQGVCREPLDMEGWYESAGESGSG